MAHHLPLLFLVLTKDFLGFRIVTIIRFAGALRGFNERVHNDPLPSVPPFLTYFPIVVPPSPGVGGNLAQDAADYSDPSCNNCHIPPPARATGQLVARPHLVTTQDKLPTNITFSRLVMRARSVAWCLCGGVTPTVPMTSPGDTHTEKLSLRNN